jgi:signal recognition particle subunit SRP19
MKKKGGRILWLAYLDSTIPRSKGRLLPKSLAVNKPTLQEVAQALEKLGYKFQIYPGKKYPPLWYEERLQGYVVVESNEKIRALAAKIAAVIKEMRSS